VSKHKTQAGKSSARRSKRRRCCTCIPARKQ